MMTKEIITRIAPSPTGKLHIGTARTALFSYLYAKKNKGKFFLRFEDTDQERSTKESEEEIIEGFKWLGLNWDGDIVYQMKRLDIYNKKAEELLRRGYAYKKDDAIWCDVKKILVDYKIVGKEVEARREDKVIKSTLIELPEPDLIQGKISGNVEDFVIMRSIGVPTFHFAVVIDDNDMGISHVIRGMDHFSNTPKHYLLYKVFDYELPKWAHIPLTLDTDRAKLSKRKGAVAVADFKAQGYLPEALINFIVLLGWHPKGGDEREIFTIDQLFKEFELEDMKKANAVFDRSKLDSINAGYIRETDNKNLISKMRDIVELPDVKEEYLNKVLGAVKDRMKKLTDFTELTDYFFNEPEYDPSTLIFKKSDKENTLHGLRIVEAKLERLEGDDWPIGREEFKKVLEKAMLSERLTFGDVFWPVRVALSGREQSPSPDELLSVLPRDIILQRLKKAIQSLS